MRRNRHVHIVTADLPSGIARGTRLIDSAAVRQVESKQLVKDNTAHARVLQGLDRRE